MIQSTDEISASLDASLDGLLIIWHQYASADHVGQGYPSEAPGTKLHRTSRQYGYENGSIDAEVDASIGAAVEFAVSQMADPHGTAIHVNARNLVTGVSVWRSPRLPAGDMERAQVVAEAREMLARKLQSAGLL